MVEQQTSRAPNPKASGPIQFTTLNKWRRERAMLEVYLVNGQRLVGRVRSFDRFSMLLEMPQGGCFVFHHTVSTLQPAAKGGRRPAPARSGPPRREPNDSDSRPGQFTRNHERDDSRAPAPSGTPEVKVVRKARRTIQKD